MAAKLEQPIQPSMVRMIKLVETNWGIKLQKDDLLKLEYDIIMTLDFSLQNGAPTLFVDRYMRLLDLDKDHPAVGKLAKEMCRKFLRAHQYLSYSAVQVATAALTLAINITKHHELSQSFEIEYVANLAEIRQDQGAAIRL